MEDIKDLQYFNLKKVQKLAKEVENDPKTLKEIAVLVLDGDPNLSMRASWALSHVSYISPKSIYPLLPQLMKFLRKKDQHTGAIRNTIRIFQEIDIPEKYCSEIFDICLAHVKNATLPHAVRVFSIMTLVQICKKYPELKPEVELVLNELKAFPQAPSIVACLKNQGKILARL